MDLLGNGMGWDWMGRDVANLTLQDKNTSHTYLGDQNQ